MLYDRFSFILVKTCTEKGPVRGEFFGRGRWRETDDDNEASLVNMNYQRKNRNEENTYLWQKIEKGSLRECWRQFRFDK